MGNFRWSRERVLPTMNLEFSQTSQRIFTILRVIYVPVSDHVFTPIRLISPGLAYCFMESLTMNRVDLVFAVDGSALRIECLFVDCCLSWLTLAAPSGVGCRNMAVAIRSADPIGYGCAV